MILVKDFSGKFIWKYSRGEFPCCPEMLVRYSNSLIDSPNEGVANERFDAEQLIVVL